MKNVGVICLDRGAISALGVGTISPRYAPVYRYCRLATALDANTTLVKVRFRSCDDPEA